MVGKLVMMRSQQLAGQGVSYWPRNKEKVHTKEGFFPKRTHAGETRIQVELRPAYQ